MKILIISDEDQRSLDNIVLGEEITVPSKLFDDKKPDSSPIPGEYREKAHIKLDHYIKTQDYDSAVSLISRSMAKSHDDLYSFKPNVSELKISKRNKSDRLRQDDIRKRYFAAVKKGSEALFTIGNKTNEHHYIDMGIDLLLRYEKDKNATKNSDFRLAGNFGDLAYKTLLPLAPANQPLQMFVLREYLERKEGDIGKTLEFFRGTPLEGLAESYFSQKQLNKKAA